VHEYVLGELLKSLKSNSLMLKLVRESFLNRVAILRCVTPYMCMLISHIRMDLALTKSEKTW